VSQFDAIAETDLVGTYPSGEIRRVRLRVGKPYPVGNGDHTCPVAAEGLDTRLVDIHGVGSWHSLTLAIRLLKRLVQGEVVDGVVFHWPDDNHPVRVDDLFP
jgi:hypothetical protein